MILKTKNLNLFYGSTKAINNCNINIKRKNKVTAIISPSGCGKSTLIRSMNRMNDFIDSFSIKGEILFDEKNIYDSKIDATELRRKYRNGIPKPNPFPKSIYENIILNLKNKWI